MQTASLFETKKTEQKPKKRKINPDKAPGLVNYFYSLTKTKSPSYTRECHNVKALLNKGYTPDQIRLTMTYLYKKKSVDLRWINRSIEEAILDDKYWNERTVKNTAAYFVKMFYNRTKTKFNRLNFLNNVNKIQMLLDNNYTPNDITRAIDYMCINHIKIFNYISSVITHSSTVAGNSELRYANIEVDYENYDIAVNLYLHKSYLDTELTRFEFAYLVKLPLNKELIEIGIQDKKQNDYKFNIQNVAYDKDEFLNWLQTQFSINKVAYNL